MRVTHFALALLGVLASAGRSRSQSVCCGPPKICNNSIAGHVMRDTLYFVHPVPTANITMRWSEHNVADALGDAAFLCVDVSAVRPLPSLRR